MPPLETSSTHSTRRYILWLGLLFVLVIGIFVWRIVFPGSTPTSPTPATIDSVIPRQAPVPTDTDYVTAQKGFQYLVSYTNTRFSPNTLTVIKGETVRFTNNSQAPLNLSVTGMAPQTLVPGAYVEYPFVATGSTTFSDGSITGSIVIR